MTHVLCWEEDARKADILRLLRDVSHSAKLATLWPLLKTALEADIPAELALLLSACFDSSASSALNDKEGEHWPVFTKLVIRSVEEPRNTLSLSITPAIDLLNSRIRIRNRSSVFRTGSQTGFII